ncbi:MAG: hypothetical protein D6679_05515 [Candidatus Hydrogenedentota bacterium]|nr:MAG: hypothetical protein D6679_05515 [Candidatus Hydrogenedentota bacterium]
MVIGKETPFRFRNREEAEQVMREYIRSRFADLLGNEGLTLLNQPDGFERPAAWIRARKETLPKAA